MSQHNLKFELSNILYNLATLYSQLAASANCSSADELKSACNNFCLTAGVISYIKTTVILKLRSTPEDMDIATLESLQQLLLAQAQECYWHRAVVDSCRDALIAKLAA
jgi:programmed cell death 6-interacting protein